MRHKLKFIQFIPLLAVCFLLSAIAQAVSPTPDGGYPGFNTAEGFNALFSLTTGAWNTGIGAQALYSNSTGSRNTAIGVSALLNHKTNNYNNAVGAFALKGNVNGNANNAVGDQALYSNTTGSYNIGVGDDALLRNINGSNNTGVGAAALYQDTAGSNNTALGWAAGINLTSGSGNVYIGASVGGVASENNTTRIRNITSTPQNSGVLVTVDSVNGNRLGYVVNVSSQRYKEDIAPIERSSEALFALKPVKFRYKQQVDPDRAERFGLIAEDVERINPDLVVRDSEGKPNTVRYESIDALLLNEFLKEHHKVQDLEDKIAQQQKEMKVLTAQLKQQAAQIQKVTSQLEKGKPAVPVVATNP